MDAPVCARCNEGIKGTFISAGEKDFHPEHFVCDTCGVNVSNEFYFHEGAVLCTEHYSSKQDVAPCARCTLLIYEDVLVVSDKKYHQDCFTCVVCNEPLGTQLYTSATGELHCVNHNPNVKKKVALAPLPDFPMPAPAPVPAPAPAADASTFPYSSSGFTLESTTFTFPANVTTTTFSVPAPSPAPVVTVVQPAVYVPPPSVPPPAAAPAPVVSFASVPPPSHPPPSSVPAPSGPPPPLVITTPAPAFAPARPRMETDMHETAEMRRIIDAQIHAERHARMEQVLSEPLASSRGSLQAPVLTLTVTSPSLDELLSDLDGLVASAAASAPSSPQQPALAAKLDPSPQHAPKSLSPAMAVKSPSPASQPAAAPPSLAELADSLDTEDGEAELSQTMAFLDASFAELTKPLEFHELPSATDASNSLRLEQPELGPPTARGPPPPEPEDDFDSLLDSIQATAIMRSPLAEAPAPAPEKKTGVADMNSLLDSIEEAMSKRVPAPTPAPAPAPAPASAPVPAPAPAPAQAAAVAAPAPASAAKPAVAPSSPPAPAPAPAPVPVIAPVVTSPRSPPTALVISAPQTTPPPPAATGTPRDKSPSKDRADAAPEGSRSPLLSIGRLKALSGGRGRDRPTQTPEIATQESTTVIGQLVGLSFKPGNTKVEQLRASILQAHELIEAACSVENLVSDPPKHRRLALWAGLCRYFRGELFSACRAAYSSPKADDFLQKTAFNVAKLLRTGMTLMMRDYKEENPWKKAPNPDAVIPVASCRDLDAALKKILELQAQQKLDNDGLLKQLHVIMHTTVALVTESFQLMFAVDHTRIQQFTLNSAKSLIENCLLVGDSLRNSNKVGVQNAAKEILGTALPNVIFSIRLIWDQIMAETALTQALQAIDAATELPKLQRARLQREEVTSLTEKLEGELTIQMAKALLEITATVQTLSPLIYTQQPTLLLSSRGYQIAKQLNEFMKLVAATSVNSLYLQNLANVLSANGQQLMSMLNVIDQEWSGEFSSKAQNTKSKDPLSGVDWSDWAELERRAKAPLLLNALEQGMSPPNIVSGTHDDNANTFLLSEILNSLSLNLGLMVKRLRAGHDMQSTSIGKGGADDDLNIWQEPLPEGTNSRKGTLNKLVIHLTSFSDLQFTKAFITTYRSFTTPTVLLQKLFQRWDMPEPKDPAQRVDWKKRLAQPIKLRVCNVLLLWIEKYYNDFEPEHLKLIQDFVFQLAQEGADPLAAKFTNLLKKKEQEMSGTKNLQVPGTIDISDFLVTPNRMLHETNLVELTKQMCLVDFRLFSALQGSEFLNQSWNVAKLKHRSPNLLFFIARFNAISNWAASLVLTERTVGHRARALTRVITILGHFRTYNNFFALMAIISGLNMSAIHRLKFTWDEVPKKYRDLFAELEVLMSSKSSFKNYRSTLKTVDPPCIPYIGLYLTDLTHVEDGNPDLVDGLINFNKRALIYNTIAEVSQYQQQGYNFPVLENFETFIGTLPHLPPETLYTLSQQREPRGVPRADLP
eukprot:TRINITY_DN1969_c0_g1_i9.p1 TRINITY_DN1969_c0_g1~~TRINITY_DN1969_c0_g1_i9.p1  ORF type:complete len:1509 (-),score=360.80 TRINITY_DN1969_c0_g1_i9:71-4597(-)